MFSTENKKNLHSSAAVVVENPARVLVRALAS